MTTGHHFQSFQGQGRVGSLIDGHPGLVLPAPAPPGVILPSLGEGGGRSSSSSAIPVFMPSGTPPALDSAVPPAAPPPFHGSPHWGPLSPAGDHAVRQHLAAEDDAALAPLGGYVRSTPSMPEALRRGREPSLRSVRSAGQHPGHYSEAQDSSRSRGSSPPAQWYTSQGQAERARGLHLGGEAALPRAGRSPTNVTHSASATELPRAGGKNATSSLLSHMGPAAAATTTEAPSDAFDRWLLELDRTNEARLLHEARRRFLTYSPGCFSLTEFRRWLHLASQHAEEATLHTMRREQIRTWLLCVQRLRGSSTSHTSASLFAQDVPLVNGGVHLPVCVDGCMFGLHRGESMPSEVGDCVAEFLGGRHVWGPINAARARLVAEAALRPVRRCEEILRAAALAALVCRYVHPYVAQAAETGQMQCHTEILTDDVALQALVESSRAETFQEIGSMVAKHLVIDGFAVELKYFDPEYGLWRDFWVEKCNRLRLTLMW